MSDFLAAVDPGTSGGMAWQTPFGDVETCAMGQRSEFVKALNQHFEQIIPGATAVYIEKVGGYYPKPKVTADGKPEFNLQNSAFSMFNFGKAGGVPYGICEAFGITPIEVMPAQWQKVCFVKKSGTRQQWKNRLKEIAQKRFPGVKVTLANCDALLLLSYGMLMSRGSIETAPNK